MNSYQQRLEEELFALSDKLQKLLGFFATDAYDQLSKKEQELLYDQSEIMQDYANILQDRLFIIKE